MKSGLRTLALALLPCVSGAVAADPISVDTWFKGPRLQNVSISPDGRYLSMVVSDGSEGYIAVKDLDADGPAKPVFATDPKQDIDAHSCGWVSATRLVCWFTGRTALDGGGSEIRNLVALDPDGGNRRFLLTKGAQGNPLQPNISVLAWRTDEPDTMLLVGRQAGTRLRAIGKLNVNTDEMRLVSKGQEGVTFFQDDGFGNVRVGGGTSDSPDGKKEIRLYSRKSNAEEWKPLSKVAGLRADSVVRLLPEVPGTWTAHAIMEHKGQLALFRIDLTDQKPPELIHAYEGMDIGAVIGGARGKLLGVWPQSSLEGAWYLDSTAAAVDKALSRSFPDRWNRIDGASDDEKVFAIRTFSLSEPLGYYVLDRREGGVKFTAVGSEWPGLAKLTLPKTTGHRLATRSGRTRELLFTPASGVSVKAPLVVFTDGAQTTGGFEPASYFLSSRGYAVLRSYLKPAGQGADARPRPFMDWNGTIYDEVTDAVRWASARPDVDASRVCIVGRGAYGGYQALLAAVRGDGMFKCAASVRGLSDLIKPRRKSALSKDEPARALTDEQVKRESPLARAADFRVPVMLIEGSVYSHHVDDDEGGREMASALKKAGKRHELVLIDEFDDAYTGAVYAALEKFLAANLGAN